MGSIQGIKVLIGLFSILFFIISGIFGMLKTKKKYKNACVSNAQVLRMLKETKLGNDEDSYTYHYWIREYELGFYDIYYNWYTTTKSIRDGYMQIGNIVEVRYIYNKSGQLEVLPPILGTNTYIIVFLITGLGLLGLILTLCAVLTFV